MNVNLLGFVCPLCHEQKGSKVVHNRLASSFSSTRRSRRCLACGEKFTTIEMTNSNEITSKNRDAFLILWNSASKKERLAMMPIMNKLIDQGMNVLEGRMET